jgi:plasmid stabilization system protein ParE
MLAPKRHPLVRADLQSAYDWYEDELPGLGNEFREEFLRAYRRLGRQPFLFAVRPSGIRRVPPDRFPYGIFFYIVKPEEVLVLAVLHGSRETKSILAGRRRTFRQF